MWFLLCLYPGHVCQAFLDLKLDVWAFKIEQSVAEVFQEPAFHMYWDSVDFGLIFFVFYGLELRPIFRIFGALEPSQARNLMIFDDCPGGAQGWVPNQLFLTSGPPNYFRLLKKTKSFFENIAFGNLKVLENKKFAQFGKDACRTIQSSVF